MVQGFLMARDGHGSSETLGKSVIFVNHKGSDVVSLEKLSPTSCCSFQKEEPPAVAADDSTCQPKAARPPLPHGVPPPLHQRENAAVTQCLHTGGMWGTRSQALQSCPPFFSPALPPHHPGPLSPSLDPSVRSSQVQMELL